MNVQQEFQFGTAMFLIAGGLLQIAAACKKDYGSIIYLLRGVPREPVPPSRRRFTFVSGIVIVVFGATLALAVLFSR